MKFKPSKTVFPNLLTFLNIVAGLTGIMMVVEGYAFYGCYLVLIAAILDGMDGRLARRLGVSSDFGGRLDDMADLISFGVAPAFIFWGCLGPFKTTATVVCSGFVMIAYVSSVAWRICRNATQGDMRYFMGIPSPMGSGIALFPVWLRHTELLAGSPSVIELQSMLMIASLLMVGPFKINSWKKRRNPMLVLFLIIPFLLFMSWTVAVACFVCVCLVMYGMLVISAVSQYGYKRFYLIG